jgi:hypothetical protein
MDPITCCAPLRSRPASESSPSPSATSTTGQTVKSEATNCSGTSPASTPSAPSPTSAKAGTTPPTTNPPPPHGTTRLLSRQSDSESTDGGHPKALLTSQDRSRFAGPSLGRPAIGGCWSGWGCTDLVRAGIPVFGSQRENVRIYPGPIQSRISTAEIGWRYEPCRELRVGFPAASPWFAR